MSIKVSVKKASDVDATNAYVVTIFTENPNATVHSTEQVFNVHIGPKGRGLWIDGNQVLGNMQFSVSGLKRPAEKIRKYFAGFYSKHVEH